MPPRAVSTRTWVFRPSLRQRCNSDRPSSLGSMMSRMMTSYSRRAGLEIAFLAVGGGIDGEAFFLQALA